VQSKWIVHYDKLILCGDALSIHQKESVNINSIIDTFPLATLL
jgi:hypothetical protein